MTSPYRALTFDCFGTLIDWRRGEERVLKMFPSLEGHHDRIPEILDARGTAEIELEGGTYRPYAEILGESLAMAVERLLGLQLTEKEKVAFGAGQLGWPAHEDTVAGLRALAEAGIPIGLLSNCDHQILQWVAKKHFGIPIALFVSAEQVRSYKPAPGHWHRALEELQCQPQDVLHVSFTPFYDLEPAHELGFQLGFLGRYDTPEPQGLPFAVSAPDMTGFVRQVLARLT